MNGLGLLQHLLIFNLSISFNDFIERLLDSYNYKSSLKLNFVYIFIMTLMTFYIIKLNLKNI